MAANPTPRQFLRWLRRKSHAIPMRSRVQGLPPSLQGLLSRASVLGETFDLSLLAAVSGHDADALLDMLEIGHKHGLVVPESPSTYRWIHDLLRQLVYNDTPASERVALHRKAAELLEA